MDLGLAHGLDQVGADPLPEGGHLLVPEGPGAEQGLVEEVLVVGVRGRPVLDTGLEGPVERTPGPDQGRPLPGQLGEDVQAGAHVLSPLGVVGGRRVHGVGPLPVAFPDAPVERGRRPADPIQVAAHLVERDEAVEDIEGRVLEALGHEGPGDLLKPADELDQVCPFLLGHPVPVAEQEKGLEKPDLPVEVGTSLPCAFEGVLGEGVVRRRVTLFRGVGPVDREPRQHLDQGGLEAVHGDVPGEAVLGRQAFQSPSQVVHLAGHLPLNDQPLLFHHQDAGIRRQPGEPAVGPGQPLTMPGGAEELVDPVEEVVARGPVDREGVGEGLFGLEDLFHQEVAVPHSFAKGLQVGEGIVETVDVVDPKPGHRSPVQPAEHQAVGEVEHPPVLLPEADQLVDVEEPPVVDLLGGHLPEGEPEVLLQEQGLQAVEGARVSGLAVERLQVGVREGSKRLLPAVQGPEGPLGETRLGGALLGIVDRVERAQYVEDPEKLDPGGVILAQLQLQASQVVGEQVRVGGQGRGKGVLVVVEGEASGPVSEGDLPLLQGPPGQRAQKGGQHAAVHGLVGMVPLDVEDITIRRDRPVLEHVHEHGVFPVKRHVVGHEVLEPTHFLLPDALEERLQLLLGPQLRVHPIQVHGVVPVGAPLPGLEHGGRVNVGDAQPLEVVHDLQGVLETETGVKLEPIGGAGNGHGVPLRGWKWNSSSARTR